MTPWRPRLVGEDLHHRAEELARPLPPLLVAAERVAATVAQGVHGRRRVGQGETFWQFRRYQPGDPAAAIDWRQSAKSQPLYVRETEWEAAQSVWLWRDGSRSMDYASRPGAPSKRAQADLLLLALASLLVRGGERVALLGGKVPLASGRIAMGRLAAALAGESGDAPAQAPDTDGLPPKPVLPRHARVVLFGDFLESVDALAERIGALVAQGVRGHLLQILDPAEETLPFEGRVLFEGAEGEGTVLVGRTEAVRPTYRQRMARHREALAALARESGWTFAVHHTDLAPAPTLLALYQALAGPAAASAGV
jgi:uncharacterized protein (DUF58 family)